jgi:6-phosphogluconolactonase
VINEIASTVTAFAYDAERGALTELQTLSTLPQGFSESNSTAELEMHPSGKFLYGSNRGHNSIAVFAIDQQKGSLTLVDNVSTQGEVPRNFAIDPSGKFLFAANQQTDNIVLFRINGETGKLSPTGESVEVDAPVCIRFAAGE